MKRIRHNYEAGSYDPCLRCQYLGNGCDGPRTSSMTLQRWCEWCRELKELRGYTNAYIAERTNLSETTIERIMAGKVSQDIMRTTVALLEDFLIGSAGQWPCSLHLNGQKEIVYADSPATQEMLKERSIQIERLRAMYDALQASLDKEVQAVRDESQRKIDFLRAELEKKDKIIETKDQIIAKLIGI